MSTQPIHAPLNTWFHPTGPAVGAFDAFDNAVKEYMTQIGIRGAAVSIIKGNRLVHARAYTYAGPNTPQALPTDLFRIGSTSKLFTVLTIYRLIERGLVKTTDLAEPLVTARIKATLGSVPAVPFDPHPANTATPGHYFNVVTVADLLFHRSGWQHDGSDATYEHDPQVAAFIKTDLPVNKYQVAAWGICQPMRFYPDTPPPSHVDGYSNFGYLLLGLIVEQLTGENYIDYVKSTLFSPLGASRPRLTLALAKDRAAGETTYTVTPPVNSPSMLSKDRPMVPIQYGGENNGNFDSFGGWLVAAPDYACALSALINKQSPPMPATATATMFSGPDYQFHNYLYGHGGELSGTGSFFGVLDAETAIFIVFNTSTDVKTFIYDGQSYGVGDHPAVWQKVLSAIPAASWPKHDLFPAMLGPEAADGVRYDGVWSPSSEDQFVSFNKSFEEHEALYKEWWDKGYRLAFQNAYVSDGTVRYDGIWNPGAHGQYVTWQKTSAEISDLYNQHFDQKFRLTQQQAHVINGQVLYNAIWDPGTANQYVSRGKALEQHQALYKENWDKGYRLIDQQSYVLNGQVLYDGIWNQSTAGQYVSWSKTRAELVQLYADHWQNGYRLQSLDAHVEQGMVRYNGIWGSDTRNQYVSWSKTLSLLRADYEVEWPNGMRLTRLTACLV